MVMVSTLGPSSPQYRGLALSTTSGELRSPSMNNYAMHFNLLNGSAALADPRIRYVINHAIDQEYLLNLSMLGEGVLSPTMVSPNFPRVALALDSLQDYFDQTTGAQDDKVASLRQQVNDYQAEQGLDPEVPLQLTLLVQESFMFLVRDIQYFLKQVNIDLQTVVLAGEKQVFRQLFATVEDNNEQDWDLLLWGNYDWYKHPWSAFFVYVPGTSWSSLTADQKLVDYTDRLLRTNLDSDKYVPLIADFIRYIYEKNYMVFLPSPNNVYAVNKEVVFNPGHSAFIYLRDLQVTDQHWSLRGDRAYAAERLLPLRVNRQSLGEASL
jgi:ABC-type transport system substrate-binding protein